MGDDLAEAISRTAAERPSARELTRLARLAGRGLRQAGAAAVASGRWLADVAVDVAGRLAIRDRDTLRAAYPELNDTEVADALVKTASLLTAAVGGAAGALAAAEEFSPPTWFAIPAELVVETLVVVAVEMKLVGELHALRDIRISGLAVARAWAEGRGVKPTELAGPDGLAGMLGRGARSEVTRLVRRRLLRRLGRNLSTLAPLFAGAAAGAVLNRRATMALGRSVNNDLART